jgi:hypothetical protein
MEVIYRPTVEFQVTIEIGGSLAVLRNGVIRPHTSVPLSELIGDYRHSIGNIGTRKVPENTSHGE